MVVLLGDEPSGPGLAESDGESSKRTAGKSVGGARVTAPRKYYSEGSAPRPASRTTTSDYRGAFFDNGPAGKKPERGNEETCLGQ